MMAKKARVQRFSSADIKTQPDKIGLDGSPTQVIKIFTPQSRGKGEMIEGTPLEQSAKLVEKLRETKII